MTSTVRTHSVGSGHDAQVQREAITSREAALRKWAGWLLVVYLVPVAVLVLSARLGDQGIPQLVDSVLHSFGDGEWFGMVRFGHLEAAANIALFVPIGFLLTGLLGRRRPLAGGWSSGLPDTVVWLLACSLSASVEITQLYLLTERSGTLRDLLCNSAGALTGVLAFRFVHQARLWAERRKTP